MEKITKTNWPEDWSAVPAWTEVDEEVYEHLLDVMPPRTFIRGYYFQAGEPYDHIEYHGFITGRYLTFMKKNGKYWYLGLQVPGFLPERRAQ